jgi:hypothetical protein
MNINKFNKELAIKIATAKGYEKSGDKKSAIKIWLEISEMTISLSKNPKLGASFRNMLMNRIKGIFQHIKILKSEKLEEELSAEKLVAPQQTSHEERSFETIQREKEEFQEQKRSQRSVSSPKSNSSQKIIEDSDLKQLPKGFKEIESSEDFEIITPHDKDFVQKQLDKALGSDHFKLKTQEGSKNDYKTQDRLDFDQPKEGKNKICFACGYDKNLIKDKVCKNCGINLD